MKEEWKDIEGYEGRYQISTYGRVKSLSRMRGDGRAKTRHSDIILREGVSSGYSFVVLYNNKHKKHASVNRLVAIAFIPNPLNKKEVNHKDFNKQNNRVDNLEWVTPQENVRHAYANGRYKHVVHPCGEQRHNAKLTESDVREIRESLKVPGCVQADLARKYDIDQKTISNIKYGRVWKCVS